MVSLLVVAVCVAQPAGVASPANLPGPTPAPTATVPLPSSRQVMALAAAPWDDERWRDVAPSQREIERDPTKHVWDGVVLPIINGNLDEGIAGGILLAAHHHHGGVLPFHDDLSMRVYVSTRLVQRHELRWEGLNVLGLPLRIRTRIGLFSTVTQTYCGIGNGVDCSEDVARRMAIAQGHIEGSAAFTDFVRRFYAVRFIRPHGDLTLRWAVLDDALRMELLAGARVSSFIPGDFLERGPYAGSLYARRYPEGEEGLSSVVQTGITLDHRDIEPAPRRGFFVEATVRGGGAATGSRWNMRGINMGVAFYVPLTTPSWSWPGMVFATRSIVDVVDGELPSDELAFIGGTRDDAAFGGAWIGRGVRDHRYVGKLKVIEQLELRTQWFGLSALWTRFDVGGALFADAAWIGASIDDVRGGSGVSAADIGSPWRILYSGGVGLRILVNRAFVVHIDVAASPFEQIVPAIYTPTGSPF